jgi:hypothetical protein
MRSMILSSTLLAFLSIFAGCTLGVSPEPIDRVSQAVVPPPGGGCNDGVLVTRTQGFWQNHSCVVKGDATGYPMVPQALGSSLILDKPADVDDYFDQPTNGDKQIILGHQLLAAKLNRAAFGIGPIEYADWNADGALETVDELIAIGDILFDAGTDADRVKMATILDKLNNAGNNEPLWFDPNCDDPPATCD